MLHGATLEKSGAIFAGRRTHFEELYSTAAPLRPIYMQRFVGHDNSGSELVHVQCKH